MKIRGFEVSKLMECVSKYYQDNNVNATFDGDGISLWTTAQGLNLQLNNCTPEEVDFAISNLNDIRTVGWENSD